MKNTLILHWWWWNSSENWFPFLKWKVEFKSDEVFVPNLPNTNFPVLDEQLEYLSVYSSDFKDWWNIVWHSLWCKLSLQFIEYNNIKNSNIVLVAPTYTWLAKELWKEICWDSYDYLEKYFDKFIDFKKINYLWNRIVIFLSQDDWYINIVNAKKYFSQIENVEFKIFKNKGHFNEWAWIFELEEILQFID